MANLKVWTGLNSFIRLNGCHFIKMSICYEDDFVCETERSAIVRLSQPVFRAGFFYTPFDSA